MTKKHPKYGTPEDPRTCKIYKIFDLETGECYIGATCQKYICDRLARHRDYIKNGIYCSSSIILNKNNYDYILVEECAPENRKEREKWHINNTPKCINHHKLNFTIGGWQKRIVQCECGVFLQRQSLYNHVKSQRHLNICHPVNDNHIVNQLNES